MFYNNSREKCGYISTPNSINAASVVETFLISFEKFYCKTGSKFIPVILPALYTIDPALYTIDHALYTIDPALYTIDPALYTIPPCFVHY